MHRMDPDTPIEETMAVLKALVQEGELRRSMPHLHALRRLTQISFSTFCLLFSTPYVCNTFVTGKIKYVGLSECTPSELRRAHAVHPVTAIQMEWSLGSRDIEATVVPVARELGVGEYEYYLRLPHGCFQLTSCCHLSQTLLLFVHSNRCVLPAVPRLPVGGEQLRLAGSRRLAQGLAALPGRGLRGK
jgi:hypothetical protein